MININDNCPNNSLIWTTDFTKYVTIALDPYGTAQVDPVWKVLNDGAEMQQFVNSDPGIAIGNVNMYNRLDSICSVTFIIGNIDELLDEQTFL